MANEMPELLDPSQAKAKKEKRYMSFVPVDDDVKTVISQLKESRRISSIKEFVSQILRTVLAKEYKITV